MAKIILNEEQLKRLIDNSLSEQTLASINTPGYAAGYAAGLKAAEKARVDAVNKPLVTPGTTADDYFKNPDGTIKVTDLPGVTVTAKRTKPTTPAQPQVNANVPGAQTGSQPRSMETVPQSTGTPPPPIQANVTSQPQPKVTAPAMSGEQLHSVLMQKGLINGFTDMDGYENRRIVYKGAPLSQEQLGTLTNFLVSKGYGKRFSQVGDKRYGQKYVWVKGGSAPLPSDLTA